MKVFRFGLYHIWMLGFLMMIFCLNFTLSYTNFENPDDPSITFTYHRFAEVKKECASVLSSVSEMKPDDNRGSRVKTELSFSNGDWEQEGSGAPLMPFDDTDMPKDYSGSGSLLKLVSFRVTDVDPVRRSEDMISISGLLYIGITRNRSLDRMPYEYRSSPEFSTSPGFSTLSVLFEGIYIESEENGGERVMCLLGTPKVPYSGSFTSPWGQLDVQGMENKYDPSLLQADQILLVLRYPQTFSLTSRLIYGEMTSLNKDSDLKYFDKVRIYSQLGHPSKYHFGSEELVTKSCNSYLYQHNVMSGDRGISEGSEFCRKLNQHVSHKSFIVVSKWKHNSIDERSYFGPFVLKGNMNAEIHKFLLVIQYLRCEPENNNKTFSTAKVAAVFRLSSPVEEPYTLPDRSGVSGTTLSAEGIWNSSTGQLCMVGCIRLVDSRSEVCNSHVHMYFPTTLSIEQRSVILVTITSINKENSYVPLSFGSLLHSVNPWDKFRLYSNNKLSYNYSKIDLASGIQRRSERFTLGNLVKKLFLQYPNVRTESDAGSSPLLFNYLSLRDSAFNMEILSVGPLLGSFCHCENGSSVKGTPPLAKPKLSVHQHLNVSAHLTFPRENSEIPMMFMEGIYDQVLGKMYLIGCRSKHGSKNSRDLEGGLDCLIEVRVEYSSTTTQWFMNPTLRISITSQRDQDDPLYFRSINFRTVRHNHRFIQDTFPRRAYEMILQILMLFVAILCLLSQLFYIRKRADDMPYISLVMLAVQGFGYGLSLIIDAGILFKWMESEFDKKNYPYTAQKHKYDVFDCIMKFLLMIAFQLTLRLYEKVRKSRNELNKLTMTDLQKFPTEKLVFLITLATQMIGAFLVLNIDPSPIPERHERRGRFHPPPGNSHVSTFSSDWVMVLQGCLGLYQDFFLLPQIIGNMLWKIHVKPLRKVYYIGFTVMRVLFHLYSYITNPASYLDVPKQNEFTKMNPSLDSFYSRFGDIGAMMALVVFAVVIYIQQSEATRRLTRH